MEVFRVCFLLQSLWLAPRFFFFLVFFLPLLFLAKYRIAKFSQKRKEFSKCVKKNSVFYLFIFFFVDSCRHISTVKKKNQQISLLGSNMWRNFNVKEFLTALLSYPLYSQIWLKFIMDDYQFSHITNMKKKTPDWHQYFFNEFCDAAKLSL